MATTKKTKAVQPTTQRVVTTSAGTVKITEPKGTSRRRQPKITVLVNPEAAVKQQVGGFIDFLRERAIVGLAIGFVIATQVQGVVKQLIASFLDPLTQLLFATKLSERTFTWHWHGRSANFRWGAFIYALVDFFVVVITIYAVIKLFKLDKLDKKKD
jgi:large-conductance mechanosensitive channel